MKRPSLSLWLTILSFLIIFTVLIIRNYSLLQTQFLYNEHAWNFLQHALTGSLIFNLFHTDAGYLPLLPRLITLLLVRGLRVITYYPLISDLFGFAFIALCCSLVTLKPFKQYIRSDTIRFLLSIALGTALNNELFYFFNFSYYGIIVLLFGIILDKDTLNKYLFTLLTVTSIIVILSKGVFIALFPVYCLALFIYFSKKRSRIYYITLMVATLAQAASVLLHASAASSPMQLSFMGLYILKSILYLWQTYNVLLLSPFFANRTIKYICFFLLAVLMYWLYRSGKLTTLPRKIWLFLLILNCLALSSLILNIIFEGPRSATFKEPNQMFNPSLLWNELIDTPFGNKLVTSSRHYFASDVAVLISGIVLISQYVKRKILLFAIAFYVLFMPGIFGVFINQYPDIPSTNRYSDWPLYSDLINRDQYCIPVSFYPRLIKKNCNFLHDPFIFMTENDATQRFNIKQYYPDSTSWNVSGLILKNTSSNLIVLNLEDDSGKIITRAMPLNQKSDYKYYVFNKPVANIALISFFNQNGKSLRVSPKVAFFGRNVSGPKIDYENIVRLDSDLYAPKVINASGKTQSVKYLFQSSTDRLSGVFFPLDIKDFNILRYTLTVYDRACKRILRTSLFRSENGQLTSIFEPIANSRNQEYCFSISNNQFNIKTIGVLTYHDPDLSGK